MDKFLTVKEVSQKMSICQRTVIRYIKKKKLRASKIGHWRVKENDLENFFNKNANIIHE